MNPVTHVHQQKSSVKKAVIACPTRSVAGNAMHCDAPRQRFHAHQSPAHALEVTFVYKHGLALL